jgi:hypothetical protein
MKKSITLIAIIYIIFLLVLSCKKEKPPVKTCNVLYPANDLPWLRNTIDSLEQLSPDQTKYLLITMAVYQGETVFIESSCDPLGNSVFPVKNCSGELVGYLGQLSSDLITLRNILWVPANSACNVAND